MKKICVVLLVVVVFLLFGSALADEIAVGNSLYFGQYEQDGKTENGTEPIEWTILDVKDGQALLVSRYALECLPFHDTKTDVIWTDSSLRAWLNGDFSSFFFRYRTASNHFE